MYDMLISCVNRHGTHGGLNPDLPLCTAEAAAHVQTVGGVRGFTDIV